MSITRRTTRRNYGRRPSPRSRVRRPFSAGASVQPRQTTPRKPKVFTSDPNRTSQGRTNTSYRRARSRSLQKSGRDRAVAIYNQDDDNSDYYNDSEEKSIIPIVSLVIVGIVGYFGFNYLQQDNITKEITDTQTVKVDVNISSDKKEEKEEEDKREIVSTINQNKPDTKQKEIIESVIEEKKESQITPTPVVEKVKEKVEEKEKVEVKEKEKVKIEKIEPKVVVTPPPVVKEVSKSENIQEMKAKVIQKLVQKAKHKEIIKKVEKPKKPQYRVITVKRGDTLASISKRFYGNSMEFKRIIRANHDIKRASTQLRLGQKIIVPIIESKNIKNKVAKKRRIITVKKGDTLAIIAKRFYGDYSKYKKIVDANYKIKNEHTRLHIGQKIYVPR